jgi:TolB-like protein
VSAALLLLLAAAPAAPAQLPALLVMDLSATGGVTAEIAQGLTDAVVVEVGRQGFFKTLSSRDVATLLGVERQKQLLGCSDASSSCLAELSGALDARFVLSGSVSRLGEAYQLTVQTLDAQSTRVLGRGLRMSKTVEGLRASVAEVVADATGTPRPPPPSKVLPLTLLVAGAAGIIAGGGLGFAALSRESAIRRELDRADLQSDPGALRPASEYQAEASDLLVQKSLALTSLLLGTALAVTGFLVWPSERGDGGVALLFGPGSVAVAGTF